MVRVAVGLNFNFKCLQLHPWLSNVFFSRSRAWEKIWGSCASGSVRALRAVAGRRAHQRTPVALTWVRYHVSYCEGRDTQGCPLIPVSVGPMWGLAGGHLYGTKAQVDWLHVRTLEEADEQFLSRRLKLEAKVKVKEVEVLLCCGWWNSVNTVWVLYDCTTQWDNWADLYSYTYVCTVW